MSIWCLFSTFLGLRKKLRWSVLRSRGWALRYRIQSLGKNDHAIGESWRCRACVLVRARVWGSASTGVCRPTVVPSYSFPEHWISMWSLQFCVLVTNSKFQMLGRQNTLHLRLKKKKRSNISVGWIWPKASSLHLWCWGLGLFAKKIPVGLILQKTLWGWGKGKPTVI